MLVYPILCVCRIRNDISYSCPNLYASWNNSVCGTNNNRFRNDERKKVGNNMAIGCRGSKLGVKRGPYKKHKPRKYHTQQKTTTLEGKKEYQRLYMRAYMRIKNKVHPSRFWVKGRKPKDSSLFS